MMHVGAVLPSVDTQRRQRLSLTAAAIHAENVGLNSVWHGDHLAIGAPSLDCAAALAAAAAVTTRVRIGASVFIPAIRPLAWAAKQVASLQYLTDGRLVLGIGVGEGAEQWAAAGVSYRDRGRRTDAALRSLPALLAGERVRLDLEPGQPEVQLAPSVAAPPMWVGNASAVAIRRAARWGDGWFPSLIRPDEVADGARRLTELTEQYERPRPLIAIDATGILGTESGLPDRRQIATRISRAYRRSVDDLLPVPIMGGPAQAAEQLRAYRDAGAHHVVMGFADGDWRRQCELLATTRAHLN
jgi:alkanesulfonate monooxygenase SsuD/methylene tetrahydromethanopterin reductase-like flavin-dependent oxidoreductase (luciferase family)